MTGEPCYCGGCRQCLHDQGADCGAPDCRVCAARAEAEFGPTDCRDDEGDWEDIEVPDPIEQDDPDDPI